MIAGRTTLLLLAGCIAVALLPLAAPRVAHALSEVKPVEPAKPAAQSPQSPIPLPDDQKPAAPAPATPQTTPAQDDPATPQTAPAQDEPSVPDSPDTTEPAPGADEPAISPDDPAEGPAAPQDEQAPGTEAAKPQVPAGPPAEIFYGDEKLPVPVKHMRDLIVEAARKGDIEALRPLIGTGPDTTQLSFGSGIEGDPIEYVKGLSGDEEGQEILAILQEIMESGYVMQDDGNGGKLFVWPYFAGVPIDKLTPPQRVELFKIITSGDYEDMKSYGSYIFYRVGITPEGKWQYFVAGD